MEKAIQEFWSVFWDLGFFRRDFRGFVEDVGDDVCRIFGGVLICVSYSFRFGLGGF